MLFFEFFFFWNVITYLNMWTACPLARDIGLCLLFVCLCVLTKYWWFDRCVFMRDVGIASAHINEHTNVHTEPANIKKKKCCICVAMLVAPLLVSARSINITIHAAIDMPEKRIFFSVLPWPTRHETFSDLMWFRTCLGFVWSLCGTSKFLKCTICFSVATLMKIVISPTFLHVL